MPIKNIVDDNDMELDPSDNSAITDDVKPEAAASAEPSATPAATSPATGDNDEKDLLSVVRDVVDERQKPSAAASPAEGDEPALEAGGTPKEQDNEEFSDVPFHKHPRFRQLVEQRNSFKADAERYQNVQNFLESNGLTSEEAADGLSIMAQAKLDPAGAWQRIKPWVQKVLVAAGEVLPDDLQQRVAKGEIAQDTAFELSRARAQTNTVQARQTFEQQQRERRQQAEVSNSLVRAANDWEEDRRKKDPNFAAKVIPLQKEIAYLHSTEGRPKDAEGVRDQLKRAYKAVNDSFRPPAPAASQQRRPAIRPVVGGKVAGAPAPEPKSTLDIVRANRRAG